MKQNVGGMDRTARFVIGIVLLAVALFAPAAMGWRIVALIIAVIALVTATTRYCPVNAAIGIDTSGGAKAQKK